MYLNRPKGATFRIIAVILIFSFMVSFVMPSDALAARSRAGGGDIPRFNFSDFAATAGIGLGTAIVSMSIGSALGAAWSGIKGGLDASTIAANMGSALTNSFRSLPAFTTTMIGGYNTFMAGTQVVRAVGATGVYYDWNPCTTHIVSAVASGITGGILNPAAALGSAFNSALPANTFTTILEGGVIGGLGGFASSGTEVLIDRGRISKGLTPGVGAQIAGYTAGFFATNFGRDLFDPRTYAPAKEVYERKVVGQEVGETLTKPIFAYVSDSGKTLTEQEIFNMVGVEQVKRGLVDGGKISSEQFDSKGFAETLRDVQQFYKKSELFGENNYAILGDKGGIAFNNVSSAQKFNVREMQVLGDNAVVLRTGETNIAKNIFFKPFVDTFDAWPILATNALGTWAASRVDENYSQFIKLAINSMGGAVVDSFANAYNLRPSLLGAQELLGNSAPGIERFISRGPETSSFDRFSEELSKKFTLQSGKYQITSALLSGAISVAANTLIGTRNKNTGMYDRPIDSMLISLAGVLGTGIARGIAWNLYNEDLRSDDINAAAQYHADPNKNIVLNRVDSVIPSGFVNSVLASLDTETTTSSPGTGIYPEAPNFTSHADRDYVISFIGEDGQTKVVKPGDADYEKWNDRLVDKEIGKKLVRGMLYPERQYYVTLDSGEEQELKAVPAKVTYIPKNPDMVTTILGSVSQGLYEFGSQSMAMNLPFAQPGTLPTSAWVTYSNKLFYASRAAASRGFWQVMENNVVSTGVDVIRRNTLSAIADTPLGKFMGAAPFITFEGYKGQPFNVAILYGVETPIGKKVGKTAFYDGGQWPTSARIDINPEDLAWRTIISRSKINLLGANGPNDISKNQDAITNDLLNNKGTIK